MLLLILFAINAFGCTVVHAQQKVHHKTELQQQREATCSFQLRMLLQLEPSLCKAVVTAASWKNPQEYLKKHELPQEALKKYGLSLDVADDVQAVSSIDEFSRVSFTSEEFPEMKHFFNERQELQNHLGVTVEKWCAAFAALRLMYDCVYEPSRRATGEAPYAILKPNEKEKMVHEYLALTLSEDEDEAVIHTPWGTITLIENNASLVTKLRTQAQLKLIDEKSRTYKIIALGSLKLDTLGIRLHDQISKRHHWQLLSQFFTSSLGQSVYDVYQRLAQEPVPEQSDCRCIIL